MKLKVLTHIVIIGIIVAVTSLFTNLAAIDAPHNASNTMNCGDCHGQTLLNSPFWTNSEDYDIICTSCHTGTGAPYAASHAEKQCRDCHNPHYQRQKMYKNTDAGNLYLATGKITSCTHNCDGTYNPGNGTYNNDGTSILTYESITYKPGWNAEKLNDKTVKGGNDKRSAILFPNVTRLGYNYPITAVDTPALNTITVKGNVTESLCPQTPPCPVSHVPYSCDLSVPKTFSAIYGQYIKDVIAVSGTNKQVKSYDRKGINSFADGDGIYNGLCEICHTQTKYHKDDGSGEPHYPAVRCTICHLHMDGFADSDHTGRTGADCEDCHGHDDGWNGGSYYGTMQSHSTHTENDSDDLKGPNIPCSDCHNTSSYPDFADGATTLASTIVCNNCHSPGGAYDGVNDAVIGAKNNWRNGVYASPTLKAGKEKWCAGCHDNQPANSKADATGINAPNIAGDNITFGFYVNGHKSRLCSECHDLNINHIDGSPRTYAFNSTYYGPSQSGIAYASGYRLRYIDGEVPLMIPSNYNITFSYNAQTMKDNAFRLCFDCHQSAKILDNTPGDGLYTNFKASLPNPPRNYSYAWGSGADVNEHVAHILNYIGPFWDSDWDTGTTGAGGSDGRDSLVACSSCHNVHGSDVTHGSTNEPMIRDGSLVGRTGYGFSYVIEDLANGGFPMVTSSGAYQQISHGAIFRNNTANMCGGSMCHGTPTPPTGSSYDASGSSWGTYLEYYRAPQNLF
jgi:hypothetical protein